MPLTRYLMTASALFLGVLGLLGTFAPDHLLRAVGATVSSGALVIAQAAGALYLGFAGLNWMARGNLIGGIYSRPLVVGNLMHFLVASIALTRAVASDPGLRVIWPIAVVYAAFAVAFGVIIFRHPVRAEA